jgi:hypothetical protein
MKKICFAIALLSLSLTGTVFAQDCPFGLTNDPYPGECGRYIDTDNDNICDHSQTSAEAAQTDNLSGNQPLAPDKVQKRNDYYFWQMILLSGAAWFFSALLIKTRKLNLSSQRKFWNFLLFASFLATAATSIIMLLNESYNASIKVPFDLVFWHIESGLAMSIISVLHIFWHIPYIKSYFPKKGRQP